VTRPDVERIEVLSRTFNRDATGIVAARLLVVTAVGHFEQELKWPGGIMPEVFEEMVRAVGR
jgi:hypothetical protein